MKHKTPLFALACLAGLVSLTTTSSCTMKQFSGSRDTGQSKLMDQTFAGQNACNPDDHTRPFIIEWDATDMSSFESLAASDIVMVKYEGCSLRILDECRNDSVRGSQGAYKPPEWTSGSLETIDIHNEGELYAKLPLGSATLGGRGSGGESFHMEYFVAGTTYATRDAVYEADLDGVYGCEEATHFVYAYNLGAFALGSYNETNAEVGASMYGFGGGGSRSSGSAAEKKGGELSACRADDATEVASCKTPIRLNLRKLRPGESPETEAMSESDDLDSLSAAGMINQRLDMSDEAFARIEAAQAKAVAGDGKGCLKELDAHDGLDPDHKSTDPSSPYALPRAQCVMMSGKCNAGKQLARKALAKQQANRMAPEQIDSAVQYYAATYCQGDSMSERDQLVQALNNLQQGAFVTHKDVEFCDQNFSKVKKLLPKVEPKNDDDSQIINAEASLFSMVPLCYQRAGDCKKSRKVMDEVLPPRTREAYKEMTSEQRDAAIQSNWESIVPKCKGEL